MVTAVLLAVLHFPLVLMYHRVDVSSPGDRVSETLTVSPQQFSDEMSLLARRGMRAMSLDQFYELVRDKKPTENVVLVTFDDGYGDQYRYAVPILLRYHFGATFFVNTGTVGKARHVTWQELHEMERDGMSIEAHGVDHVDLAQLASARQAFEILTCIRTLEANLGTPVHAFAYPSGEYDAQTVDIVREAGLSYAFTTDPFRTLVSGSPYELSRRRVVGGLDDAAFGRLVGTTP